MMPGDILDGTVGPGFHWKNETREKYRKGYGRWLTFLIVNGLFCAQEVPQERVTPDRVAQYIEELQAQDVGSWTLWGRLAELLAAIKAIAPDKDFSWLRRIVRYYENNTVDRRNKHARLQPADRILSWSINQMDEITKDPPLRDAAGKFRDALVVGFLACCPIRLGNLVQMQIDQHLIRSKDGYRIRFTAEETKTGHPISAPVADSLTEYFDRYFEEHRPELLLGGESSSVWITRYSTPMRTNNMYAAITRTTERAFGTAINPHLFRDCAATFVALEDPDHIGIAAPILGHIDPRATEKHYIQANQIAAGRRIRKSVSTLRKKLPIKRKRGKQ
jgi:integrase